MEDFFAVVSELVSNELFWDSIVRIGIIVLGIVLIVSIIKNDDTGTGTGTDNSVFCNGGSTGCF